jgi:hypothetical protein
MKRFPESLALSSLLIFSLALGACVVVTPSPVPAAEQEMGDMEGLEQAEGGTGESMDDMEGMEGAEESSGESMVDMEDMAMHDHDDEIPADLDTATTRTTEQGTYQVSLASNLDSVGINQIHSWTLTVKTPDGQPVENSEIALDGGMPQHDHGFPTSPQVTRELGDGEYLVEGVKFNMAGWWEMRFDITADGQSDSVTFNVVLQ